jgi:ketosteroid isomerase-like protein
MGWDSNRAFFSTVIRPMWHAFALTCITVHALRDDPERIVAEYASDASLVDGSPYRNTYLALGTVRDGRIQHWTEFSDPAPLQQGLAALHEATPAAEGH